MTKQDFTEQVEETKVKLQAIFADEEEVKRFFSIEEPEDVQAYLKEKDIEMTIGQIKAMKELFEACAEGKVSREDMELLEKGEIPESMLEDVNGGNRFSDDETTDNILTGAIGAGGGAVTAVVTCCLATGPVGVGVVACLAVGAAGAIAGKYIVGGIKKLIKW